MKNPPAALRASDIEAIERGTLAAVPPQACEELEGWLLAFDTGTVGRAHSAVPLDHVAPAPSLLEAITDRYAAHKLPPVLRVARVAAFDALCTQLQDAGFAAAKPTLVQVASASDVARLPGAAPVELSAETGGAQWQALFLGQGFDPVDGESRLGILRRGRSSLFASVRVEGELAAVGSACFSHGWASVHGMRTAAAFRGRGLAGSILARFAQEALARGITRVFLQVEGNNRVAQSLYRRAGFTDAWGYEYWKPAP